jgi:homogentisate 1,2-dioxygenase
MTDPRSEGSAPATYVGVYTRDGFAGLRSTIIRRQYTAPFRKVQGSYVPRCFNVLDVRPEDIESAEGMPVTLMQGDGIVLEVAHHDRRSTFALRNVAADEVHFILRGRARLETDFGLLDLVPGDFVHIPRAVSYRFGAVDEPVVDVVVGVHSQLVLRPDNAPGTLNVARDADEPRPWGDGDVSTAEHSLVIRHGEDTTTYVYDYDPLPSVSITGPAVVQRFNFADVHALSVEGAGGVSPARIFDDPSTRHIIFNISSRRSARPPVHDNADYDEIAVYTEGPDGFGAITRPGTVGWVPKGVIHHGPEEDASQGFKAFLIETRASMQLCPAAERIAVAMETGRYGPFSGDDR